MPAKPRRRLVHYAALFGETGVSALCFSKPRAINLEVATWTLNERTVTCSKCRRRMAERG